MQKYSTVVGLIMIALCFIGLAVGTVVMMGTVVERLTASHADMRGQRDRCYWREEAMQEDCNTRCEYTCTPLIDKYEALEMAYSYLYDQTQQTVMCPTDGKCDVREHGSACYIIYHSVDDIWGSTVSLAKEFLAEHCRGRVP